MGSCLSRQAEPAPPVPASAPKPEPVARAYHERYTSDDIDMATMQSGRRPIEGTKDYLLSHYSSHIVDILDKVKKLPAMLEEIHKDYEKNMSITGKIGTMRRDIDTIRRAYEDFFRVSIWQIDDFVHERKLLSTEGYFTLEHLKDTIEGIARRSYPDFPEATRSVEKQVRMAQELIEHFYRTGPTVPELNPEDTEL